MDKVFPEWVLKLGGAGVMAIWLFTQNERLKIVEDKLYNCYESKIMISGFPSRKTNDNVPSEIKLQDDEIDANL